MNNRDQIPASAFGRNPFKKIISLLLAVTLVSGVCPSYANAQAAASLPAASAQTVQTTDAPDYSKAENWAYFAMTEQTLAAKDDAAASGLTSDPDVIAVKPADCFIVCPSVYSGDSNHLNMSLDDNDSKYSFLGALNMEAGIYMNTCRMYSPYYRMMSLSCYDLDMAAEESGTSLGTTQHAGGAAAAAELAYSDVRNAFKYYLANENNGRPIVLAGFSQGAEMTLRLLEEFGDNPRLKDNLVSAYVIGWRITKDDLAKYPSLKMAQCESDTGVIVSFNTEEPGTKSSIIVPKDTYTYGINPLNWKTGKTPADKSKNIGACFTKYSGGIKNEIPQYTGAYLSPERGTLIVTDVNSADYPQILKLFPVGIYHLYDYQFFYRNLQKNVAVRTAEYISAK